MFATMLVAATAFSIVDFLTPFSELASRIKFELFGVESVAKSKNLLSAIIISPFN
jgi:hypothetical protein